MSAMEAFNSRGQGSGGEPTSTRRPTRVSVGNVLTLLADKEGSEEGVTVKTSDRLTRVSISHQMTCDNDKIRKDWSLVRRNLVRLTESRLYEVFMGLVVCVTSGLIIHETDLRAAEEEDPVWRHATNVTLIVIYTMDVAFRLYVHRQSFFECNWNKLDLAVVLSDMVGQAAIWLAGDGDSDFFPSFAVLRICRIFRLLRLVRLLLFFRELHLMLIGFLSAMRAMFWASCMLMIMLTLWSVIAVEVLNPINQRLVEQGTYERCPRCKRAFSSVMASNITFLQQVIAGDSWGEVSIPIIEAEPWTAIILFAVMITVNCGLLNLILTAIVDVANTARDSDQQAIIADKAENFAHAKRELLQLCQELDSDKSGTISYEEMLQGIDENPRFAATLMLMDVTKDDLWTIYGMLDTDNSGLITYREFVEQLHKMKTQDTHTMTVLIKGLLNDMRNHLLEHSRIIRDDVRADVKKLLQEMHEIISGRSAGPPESSSASDWRVSIQGAQGLGGVANWSLSAETYCVCEVAGQDSSKLETQAVRGSAEPVWNLEWPLDSFGAGDSLVFTVRGREAAGEGCLGRAVLTNEEVTRKWQGCFDGELQLKHDGGNVATLKVKVARTKEIDTNGGTERDCLDKNPSSLSSIEAMLLGLSQRMDGELRQLMQDVVRKADEQVALLQDWKDWAAAEPEVLEPPDFHELESKNDWWHPSTRVLATDNAAETHAEGSAGVAKQSRV